MDLAWDYDRGGGPLLRYNYGTSMPQHALPPIEEHVARCIFPCIHAAPTSSVAKHSQGRACMLGGGEAAA